MSEYELVEFVEPAFHEGGSFAGTLERVLGVYDIEAEAIARRSQRMEGLP